MFLDINWEAEGINVKEAIFSVVKAHDLYDLMTVTEKARFDELLELMEKKSKRWEVKEECADQETKSLPQATLLE